MAGGQDTLIYVQRTVNHGYQYQFHPKHHGGGHPTDAMWLPEISHHDEFLIFNWADTHSTSDDTGNLYGLRIGNGGGSCG